MKGEAGLPTKAHLALPRLRQPRIVFYFRLLPLVRAGR